MFGQIGCSQSLFGFKTLLLVCPERVAQVESRFGKPRDCSAYSFLRHMLGCSGSSGLFRPAGPVSASGYETVGRPERPEAQGYETEGRPEKPEAQGYETVGRPEGPEAQGYETLFGGTAVGGRSLLKPYGPLNATQY